MIWRTISSSSCLAATEKKSTLYWNSATTSSHQQIFTPHWYYPLRKFPLLKVNFAVSTDAGYPALWRKCF
jgi:hypothetical protein